MEMLEGCEQMLQWSPIYFDKEGGYVKTQAWRLHGVFVHLSDQSTRPKHSMMKAG